MPISAINNNNDNLSAEYNLRNSGLAAFNNGVNNNVNPAASNSETDDKKSSDLKVSENVYGDTISVSEDGDTVQADKVAMMSAALEKKVVLASNDGTVTENESNNLSVSNEKEMVDDLTGMTSSQVEILYRQGRVSYQDYMRDIEKKEALKADTEDNQTDNDLTNIRKEESALEDKTDSNKNIEKLQDEEKSELIEQQKQAISEFDRELGKLTYVSGMTDIENIALTTAIDTGNFDNIQKLGLI